MKLERQFDDVMASCRGRFGDAEASLASAEVGERMGWVKRVMEIVKIAILTVLFGPGVRLDAPAGEHH
jgi:hypothetical protein